MVVKLLVVILNSMWKHTQVLRGFPVAPLSWEAGLRILYVKVYVLATLLAEKPSGSRVGGGLACTAAPRCGTWPSRCPGPSLWFCTCSPALWGEEQRRPQPAVMVLEESRVSQGAAAPAPRRG